MKQLTQKTQQPTKKTQQAIMQHTLQDLSDRLCDWLDIPSRRWPQVQYGGHAPCRGAPLGAYRGSDEQDKPGVLWISRQRCQSFELARKTLWHEMGHVLLEDKLGLRMPEDEADLICDQFELIFEAMYRNEEF